MRHKDIYTNCLAFQLTQARKHVFTWYEGYLRPLGLTPSFVYVLGVLKDIGRGSPSEISRLLELERPTVTALLDRMEKAELIEKHVNPNNKREVLVQLTSPGSEACDRAYPLLIEADKALNELLLGEFAQVKESVEKLNDKFREAHHDEAVCGSTGNQAKAPDDQGTH